MQIGGIAYINCLRGGKKNSSVVDWLHHLATTLSKICGKDRIMDQMVEKGIEMVNFVSSLLSL